MNQRTIEMAEKALMDFIRKSTKEHDYFKGRLVQADNLPAPKQHMVSAAARKLNWYKVELSYLEGELEILREELGLQEDTDQGEVQFGEEEEDSKYDEGGA